MPILEFLCPDCNRIYDFLAQGDYEDRVATCPRCGRQGLERQISRFAVLRGGKNPHDAQGKSLSDEPGQDPFSDPATEREMMKLMSEAEGLDESDPRQLGRFMRRMGELTGEPMDEPMEEAIRRLEAGEDPDRIEEDMGDLFGDEDAGPFGAGESPEAESESAGPRGPRRRRRPRKDSGLYRL